jgi:hypothetical protein
LVLVLKYGARAATTAAEGAPFSLPLRGIKIALERTGGAGTSITALATTTQVEAADEVDDVTAGYRIDCRNPAGIMDSTRPCSGIDNVLAVRQPESAAVSNGVRHQRREWSRSLSQGSTEDLRK